MRSFRSTRSKPRPYFETKKDSSEKEEQETQAKARFSLSKLFSWRPKSTVVASEQDDEGCQDDIIQSPPAAVNYRIPSLCIQEETMEDWISFIVNRYSNVLDTALNDEEDLLEAWRGFERVSRYISHRRKRGGAPPAFLSLGARGFDREVIQRGEDIFEAEGMSKEESVAFFGRILALHYMSSNKAEAWLSQYGDIEEASNDSRSPAVSHGSSMISERSQDSVL